MLCAACSQPAAPPGPVAAAPPPPTSGFDAAGFDKSVRPQDDLFRYVNGTWLAKTEIPADKPAYGGFYEAYDRTQEQLRVLVEDAAKTPGAPGSDTQKIGDFFASFMDEAKADHAGAGFRHRQRESPFCEFPPDDLFHRVATLGKEPLVES